MTDTFVTLDRMEDGYTVFENDQVLRPDQLNRLAAYLDEQGRLTRVGLIGVGIACGLWPSLEEGKVRLTHGVAATTDGDLMLVDEDAVYDRFRPYDTAALKYAPLERGGLPVYELVEEDEEDDGRARPIGELGAPLQTLVAVLYMESHLHDPDICSGTDCDNRGLNALFTLRLLLVDPRHAATLLEQLQTPDATTRSALEPVVVHRADLAAGALASEAALAGAYLPACKSIHDDLLKALSRIHKACGFFLGELAPQDPAAQWKRLLTEIRDRVQNRGIQYYYDFLKDLAETYNAFRDVLFGDTTVCCPPFDAFPKHVVLGALRAELRAASPRTAWFPSPATSVAEEQRLHALFLLRKIDALILNFTLPGPVEIRITPSAFEDRPLEERAIPFYYQPAVHQAWSYALASRGMERYAYSYHAAKYEGAGAAREPHRAQIGAFDFYRIEGHVGMPVGQALEALQAAIRKGNYAIDVEAVRLGTQPGKPVRPTVRFPHLYELRHLMRADVGAQLQQASQFAVAFTGQLKSADGKDITLEDNEGKPVSSTAQVSLDTVQLHLGQASAKVQAEDYNPDSTWKDDYAKALEGAYGFATSFSAVSKKEVVTPFDNLISAQPARLLSWIDVLIKDAEGREEQRMLLSSYLRDHPGLEHYAGVLRGGTFVLVHDDANVVVADFMLPYRCCEQREPPPKPPVLQPLPLPEVVLKNPVRLIPLPTKVRFEQFRDEFVTNIGKELDQYKNYFNTYKDVVLTAMGSKTGVTGVAGVTGVTGGAAGGGTFVKPGGDLIHIEDNMLASHVAETQLKDHKVQLIRTRLLDTTLPDPKRVELQADLKKAEGELGVAIVGMTQYVAAQNMEVKPGTQGGAVMEIGSASLGKVNDLDALSSIEKELTTMGARPGVSPDLAKGIGNVLMSRGLM